MTQPRLTIGIPTYNFGRFLGETLDAFLEEMPAGVEILVVDGASTDDTGQVVAARAARSPAVRYVRLEAKGGIDADVARTVDLAEGEYVWLFSADDVAKRGAVADALALIADEPDVVIVAHAGCTLDMEVIQDRYPIIDRDALDMRVHDAESRDRYLARAVTSEAFFSFLSGLIIRRESWAAASTPDRFFYGSCWGHAARLLAMTNAQGLRIRIESRPLLYRRGDNDSFLTSGVAARFALAIEGWHRIFADIFGPDAPELGHLKRVMRNEFRLKSFLSARLSEKDVAERDWLRRQFDQIYGRSPADRARRAVMRYLPRPAICALIKGKGLLRRIAR